MSKSFTGYNRAHHVKEKTRIFKHYSKMDVNNLDKNEQAIRKTSKSLHFEPNPIHIKSIAYHRKQALENKKK